MAGYVIEALDADIVRGYLDRCIRMWRVKRDMFSHDPETLTQALHYIDAFQSVRATLFDEVLS